jgi:hypothetical protein
MASSNVDLIFAAAVRVAGWAYFFSLSISLKAHIIALLALLFPMRECVRERVRACARVRA